jgi:hypothetical protein
LHIKRSKTKKQKQKQNYLSFEEIKSKNEKYVFHANQFQSFEFTGEPGNMLPNGLSVRIQSVCLEPGESLQS